MKRLMFVVLAALCVAIPLSADDGRDFAGRYDLKNVTTGSEGVSVTFFVDIQNVSGAPLTGVTFELEDANQRGSLTIGPFDMEEAATIRLSLAVETDAARYAEWSSGGAHMTGRWTDANGNTQKRVVELTRIVMPEEVQ